MKHLRRGDQLLRIDGRAKENAGNRQSAVSPRLGCKRQFFPQALPHHIAGHFFRKPHANIDHGAFGHFAGKDRRRQARHGVAHFVPHRSDLQQGIHKSEAGRRLFGIYQPAGGKHRPVAILPHTGRLFIIGMDDDVVNLHRRHANLLFFFRNDGADGRHHYPPVSAGGTGGVFVFRKAGGMVEVNITFRIGVWCIEQCYFHSGQGVDKGIAVRPDKLIFGAGAHPGAIAHPRIEEGGQPHFGA